MSDYISDQLRAEAAALRNSIATAPSLAQALMQGAVSSKARIEERAARAEQAQAAALAEWEQLRERIPDSPEGLTLRKLLDVHKPYLDSLGFGYSPPACEHCDQIGGYEREGVTWPCENYEIIKEGME